jgi:hypothetical protein
MFFSWVGDQVSHQYKRAGKFTVLCIFTFTFYEKKKWEEKDSKMNGSN